MKIRMEDLAHHLLTRGAGAFAGAQQGKAMKKREDEEIQREEAEKLRDHERNRRLDELRAAVEARRAEEAATRNERAAERDRREREEEEFEREHPFVTPSGKRVKTQEEWEEAVRRDQHIRGEERDEHRAPRSEGETESRQRTLAIASAKGDAGRWYLRNPVLDVDKVAEMLMERHPALSEGEAYDIAVSKAPTFKDDREKAKAKKTQEEKLRAHYQRR